MMSVYELLSQIKLPNGVPSDFYFRLAVETDYQPLHAACYAEKQLLQFRSHFYQALDWQENGRSAWLIGTDKSNHIIASGQLVLYPHGAELANLSVIPDRRNEGIGAALIEALTAVARHLNLPSLEIGVAVSNGRALALYQRLGFTQDRRLQLPNMDPAIVLHKKL